MKDVEDWTALAEAVHARRAELRLPLDLVNRGGPTEMTVRRIESGEATSIRPRTKDRLEYALRWRSGLVDRILTGTATQEALDEIVDHGPQRPADFQAPSSSGPTVGEVLDGQAYPNMQQFEQLNATIRSAVEAATRPLRQQTDSIRRALAPLERTRRTIASAVPKLPELPDFPHRSISTPGIPSRLDHLPMAAVDMDCEDESCLVNADLSSVDDLALASELFARISRRPPSERRGAQLRVLSEVLAEMLDEWPVAHDLADSAGVSPDLR